MGKNVSSYGFGCLKDPKDLRDIPMGLVMPEISLPLKFDFTAAMSPVRNQGDEGTCVAFASVVGMKEYQDKKEYKKCIALSPRYLYSLCKKFDKIPFEEGTYPRVAMKMLAKYGVSTEECWPYKPHQKDFPCVGADKEAKTYRIKAYARLSSLIEMKRSLLLNGPFLAGVQVFNSWFGKGVNKSGVIPMPAKREEAVGGHAICIAGYDDDKKIFKFKNSWGASWGDKGYGYLRYEYIHKYCQDSWSATDLIENVKSLVRIREEVLKNYV